MVLFNPCPISAAKIAITVIFLLVMMLKSKLQDQDVFCELCSEFRHVGELLLTTGLLTVITGGAVAYAAMQNRSN